MKLGNRMFELSIRSYVKACVSFGIDLTFPRDDDWFESYYRLDLNLFKYCISFEVYKPNDAL